MQPLWENEGSAENVNTKSPIWLWESPQSEQLPNTKHCLFFLIPASTDLKAQRPATSDKMEAVETAQQESQGRTHVQSTAVSFRASFRWVSSVPSQNGEFLTAGSTAPTITDHESTSQLDTGPSSTQPAKTSAVQCLCIQEAWQPLSIRSLQLRVCNSLRSLKEPVCFFCPRGRPTDTTQQAGLTVLWEIHRLRGRKFTYTQKQLISFKCGDFLLWNLRPN